ncbi:hypothetical protein HYPSUDRAFT_428112 [Hypholoma sublateritium FD-334 SS-4]|uniref:Uncharacterized protein n=1 Tax=Hypholoma sublateritium (strain FD-334 SS-4) TaxID=945553 RepID=A0A0D2NDG1_HYPSF|nr:hypothetical protein HYPSUDRAFT_428112 [Hypholoma sublateritium FD-334 SS-4]
MPFRESWFSPYPTIDRGSIAAKEDLKNLDEDIRYLEEIYENLKQQRARVRDLKTLGPSTEETQNKIYFHYLDVIRNQRRAEEERNDSNL